MRVFTGRQAISDPWDFPEAMDGADSGNMKGIERIGMGVCHGSRELASGVWSGPRDRPTG